MKTCSSCAHYLARKDIGTCKRYPPTVMIGGQALPQMSPVDWCGEYRETETPALALAASGKAPNRPAAPPKRAARRR